MQLLKEGTQFHTILQDQLTNNCSRLSNLRLFAESISSLLNDFSHDVNMESMKYQNKIKKDDEEEETVITLSCFLGDIVNDLTSKALMVASLIEKDVVHLLKEFESAEAVRVQAILKQSEQMLSSIEANTEFLKQLRKNVQINEESELPSQDKSLFKQVYENQITKCHDKWQSIKQCYKSILEVADTNNFCRCNFTAGLLIDMIRFINQMMQIDSVDATLRDYEGFVEQSPSVSIAVKRQLRDKMSHFILLDDNMEETLENLVSQQQEKLVIDDFMELFTSRSHMKEEYKTSYESARGFILEDMNLANYFLSKFKANLQTEIKLTNTKFRQLVTIFKYILAFVIEVQIENRLPVIYNMLYVSCRVRYKDEYMIKELGKYVDFWRGHNLWLELVEFMRNKQVQKGLLIKKYTMLGQRNPFQRWLSLSTWKEVYQRALPRKTKKTKFIQDFRIYDLLCDVNNYMVKLEIDETVIFQFILLISEKYSLSRENTRKLFELHYMHQMKKTAKLNGTMVNSRKNDSKKSEMSFSEMTVKCLSFVLEYLPLGSQLTKILLVSRLWYNTLHLSILKRYLLSNIDHSFRDKHRLKIYLTVCNPFFNKQVYQRMRDQVPSKIQNSQIISLDVRRSLSWCDFKREAMDQVLRIYSYYHHDVGYLQGMNYLCENILKLTNNTYEVYTIFEYIMNNQYYRLYLGTFEGLKLKMYQFMRILECDRPELYAHLQNEKLEGEHFLLAWAITLWGEMSGQLPWIMWDGFIIDGWKWWFKVILWLMRMLEPEIMKMNFEQIMKCFSDLQSTLFSASRKQMVDYGIDERKVRQEINKVKLQINLLNDIEKQFKMKVSIINQYMKRVKSD